MMVLGISNFANLPFLVTPSLHDCFPILEVGGVAFITARPCVYSGSFSCVDLS